MNLFTLLALDHMIYRSQGKQSTWDKSGDILGAVFVAYLGVFGFVAGFCLAFAPRVDGHLFQQGFMLMALGALITWWAVRSLRRPHAGQNVGTAAAVVEAPSERLSQQRLSSGVTVYNGRKWNREA